MTREDRTTQSAFTNTRVCAGSSQGLFLIFALASVSNEPRSNGSLKIVQEDFPTRGIVTWDNPVLEFFRLKLTTGFVLASILELYVT
jgi:hypothetical protein